jgi:gluconokinase
MQPNGFLVMGVSGAGKSTLGKALARELEWDFFDADDFHSVENIARMAAGVPLTDSDREPWLDTLNRQLVSTLSAGRHPILACSALKGVYRLRLLNGVEGMAVIFLKGSYESIRPRLLSREGHYMKETLLQSQFDTLEEPHNALVLEISLPLADMLQAVFKNYALSRRSLKE